MDSTYKSLLQRVRNSLGESHEKSKVARLELPMPEVQWIGNKTILRNFMEYPRTLRRDPDKVLVFLAKEMATAASLDGDRAIFIGRRDKQSFIVLLNRYMRELVLCPVCESPDSHLEKMNRLQFLVCEACGARAATRTA